MTSHTYVHMNGRIHNPKMLVQADARATSVTTSYERLNIDVVQIDYIMDDEPLLRVTHRLYYDGDEHRLVIVPVDR